MRRKKLKIRQKKEKSYDIKKVTKREVNSGVLKHVYKKV